MTELAAPQISSLMEALPGIAAVLRSPVANAIVSLSRAAAGLEEFDIAHAEELLRFGVRRNLLTQDEVDSVMADLQVVADRQPRKAEPPTEKGKKAPAKVAVTTPVEPAKPAIVAKSTAPAAKAAAPATKAKTKADPAASKPTAAKPAAKPPPKPAAKAAKPAASAKASPKAVKGVSKPAPKPVAKSPAKAKPAAKPKPKPAAKAKVVAKAKPAKVAKPAATPKKKR